jgi:tetratricopeptide (TPR) repeat protein
MPVTKPVSLVIAVAALCGCAVAPTETAAQADRIDVDSYRLLGDLALARQQDEEATEHYLRAAMAADDPALAESAARLAYRLGLDSLGHRAVARWRELDPDNALCDYFSGIFQMRSGRADAAVEDFAALLDTLPSRELGGGFVLVLEALNNEPTVGIAAEIMRELTSRYPATREGHYGMAQLALRAGAFGLALEESEAAIELDPDWPEARLLHARTLLLAGRSDEALEVASELADSYDNTEVKLQFAELLLSAGETRRAEALLNELLDANPGMPEAIRALAFMSLADGELGVAREQFEMLRTDPSYRDEAFFYLGRIAELESDFLQATRSYSRVTNGIRAVDAQIATAAILYDEMDDPESALRHLREFGIANPRFAPEMLVARARLMLEMERPQEAIALIDAALDDQGPTPDQSLQDAHVRFYATLVEDAIQRGDLEAAEGWIAEALAHYPGDRTLRYSQSRLLQEQGRLRRAVGILEELVDESPDNPAFLNALGYLLTDRLDRHIEARGYIQRALALSPENGAILDSMGWVLFRLGEFELALDYLERAYRALEDEDAAAVNEVMSHLIDVHWALGNQDTALQMLDEGLSESPDDPFLSDVRDRLRR